MAGKKKIDNEKAVLEEIKDLIISDKKTRKKVEPKEKVETKKVVKEEKKSVEKAPQKEVKKEPTPEKKVAKPVEKKEERVAQKPKTFKAIEEFLDKQDKEIAKKTRKNKKETIEDGGDGEDKNIVTKPVEKVLHDSMLPYSGPTWKAKYGIIVTDVAMGDINVTDESMARINKIDDATIFSDAKLQSGLMATASAEALTTAAGNANGAMMGFAGMNLATNAGAGLMGAANQNVQAQAAPAPQAGVVAAAGGAVPNFCPNCGTPTNGANFCGNCGAKLV